MNPFRLIPLPQYSLIIPIFSVTLCDSDDIDRYLKGSSLSNTDQVNEIDFPACCLSCKFRIFSQAVSFLRLICLDMAIYLRPLLQRYRRLAITDMNHRFYYFSTNPFTCYNPTTIATFTSRFHKLEALVNQYNSVCGELVKYESRLFEPMWRNHFIIFLSSYASHLEGSARTLFSELMKSPARTNEKDLMLWLWNSIISVRVILSEANRIGTRCHRPPREDSSNSLYVQYYGGILHKPLRLDNIYLRESITRHLIKLTGCTCFVDDSFSCLPMAEPSEDDFCYVHEQDLIENFRFYRLDLCGIKPTPRYK